MNKVTIKNLKFEKILSHKLFKYFAKSIMIFLIFYTCILLFFYFIQDSLLFYPNKITYGEASQIINKFKNVEEIKINTIDNKLIKGWLVKNTNIKSPLIIYFGGNAEEVSDLIQQNEKFNGWSIALIASDDTVIPQQHAKELVKK